MPQRTIIRLWPTGDADRLSGRFRRIVGRSLPRGRRRPAASAPRPIARARACGERTRIRSRRDGAGSPNWTRRRSDRAGLFVRPAPESSRWSRVAASTAVRPGDPEPLPDALAVVDAAVRPHVSPVRVVAPPASGAARRLRVMALQRRSRCHGARSRNRSGSARLALGLGPSLLVFARQSSAPFPPVKDPKYRNWSEDALSEARRLGCTYADIRFTFNRSNGVAVRNGQITSAGNIGFGQFGDEETFGFGVRVIHSGVWGFASSPLVDAGGDQARGRHCRRRGQGQRDGQEVRRAARAGEGLRHVLADADQGRSVDRPARGQGRRPGRRRPTRDAEEPGRAVRQRRGELQLRVEVPGDERGLVHRAGLLLHRRAA